MAVALGIAASQTATARRHTAQKAANVVHRERWQRRQWERKAAAEEARGREEQEARQRHQDRVEAQMRLMHRRAAYFEANIAGGKKPHVAADVLTLRTGTAALALEKLRKQDEGQLRRMRELRATGRRNAQDRVVRIANHMPAREAGR